MQNHDNVFIFGTHDYLTVKKQDFVSAQMLKIQY